MVAIEQYFIDVKVIKHSQHILSHLPSHGGGCLFAHCREEIGSDIKGAASCYIGANLISCVAGFKNFESSNNVSIRLIKQNLKRTSNNASFHRQVMIRAFVFKFYKRV